MGMFWRKRRAKEQATEWQNMLYESMKQHPYPYPVKIKNLDFVIFPQTFTPNYAKASLFLLDNLGVREGDVVLDPFTGCGADAIFSVQEGAEKAVAIEKYEMPYLCARYNVHALDLQEQIDVRQGNLFDPLKPDEKFDLVVALPPFASYSSDDPLRRAFTDPEYETLGRFFAHVRYYLRHDGRVRLAFSDAGDTNHLKYLTNMYMDNVEIIASKKIGSDVDITVYEIT